MRENESGGELTIIFDNCQGQNKNNTVLELLAYLVKVGYFKQVNFVFLIVGHTKNSADAHFNCLKRMYRKSDIFTFDDLIEKLDQSTKVTVVEAKEKDFNNWDAYLSHFYQDFKRQVKQNHIFLQHIAKVAWVTIFLLT